LFFQALYIRNFISPTELIAKLKKRKEEGIADPDSDSDDDND
jgi:hypothetical protein